ncbi:MAG: hypothetical protein ACU841_03050 [Gammaproteobacteria bacterium]
MSLSTSSSRSKPGRLVLLTLTGFVIYSITLHRVNPPVIAFQNQWVGNYAVAEKYLYSDRIPRVMIVGSSMASRLVAEKFDEDVYNLSFGGGSALTGLKIIKESRRIPDMIWIETNIAERALDESMIDNLFIPFLWKVKGHVKSLQYTYQPINFLVSLAKSKYETTRPETGMDRPDKKILAANLSKHIRDHNHISGLSKKKGWIELKNTVDYFRGLGTKIVFFEMPVHSTLLSSPKYAETRSILRDLFPDVRFYWAAQSLSDHLSTSDGIHLMPNSASRYSTLLSRYIERESNPVRMGRTPSAFSKTMPAVSELLKDTVINNVPIGPEARGVSSEDVGGKDAPRKGSRRFSVGMSEGGHKQNTKLFLAES